MSFDRIDRSRLWLPFSNKLAMLIAACEARGVRYVALSGYRSVEEQDRLYGQGRTRPGSVVTNARGGQSFHNFGVAVDFAADASPAQGLQPDWSEKAYEVLAEEAQKLGLETGLRWKFKDPGHVQVPGLDLNILNAQYRVGGMQQVFSYLDRHHEP